MPQTRSAAREQREADVIQPVATTNLKHTDPAFALQASMLVPHDQEPFPFLGQWPNITWTPELCNATLSYVACKVLEPDPAYARKPQSAHKRFSKCTRYQCLVAKKGYVNSHGLPEEPQFLQGASWRLKNGRWIVQLRLPNSEEHEALMWQVIARFSKDEVDTDHLTPEQEQMHGLLMQPVSNTKRAGCCLYVHRLVCWVFQGAPDGTDSLMLEGKDGCNNTLHLCHIEQRRCLSKKHLRWGTAQENSDHRKRSEQAKAVRRAENLVV